MCMGGGRRSAPAPAPMPAPPPIMSRTNIMKESQLPEKRKIVDEDDISTVAYGSSKKEGGPAAGKKVGTRALRIPLNTGQASTSAGQGGLNV